MSSGLKNSLALTFRFEHSVLLIIVHQNLNQSWSWTFQKETLKTFNQFLPNFLHFFIVGFVTFSVVFILEKMILRLTKYILKLSSSSIISPKNESKALNPSLAIFLLFNFNFDDCGRRTFYYYISIFNRKQKLVTKIWGWDVNRLSNLFVWQNNQIFLCLPGYFTSFSKSNCEEVNFFFGYIFFQGPISRFKFFKG